MLKRAIDIAVSATALLALSGLMLVLAGLVRWRLGSPILFVQERPGRHGRIFKIMKFRTMHDSRGPDGKLLSDERRLSRFGSLMRKLSLDELPQLWNVLKGEMSLVGPRPLMVEYLERYSPEQARRHEVRPGITGLAQVNGRNDLTWVDRFKLDVWYVDHQSLTLDLTIIGKTLIKLIRPQGINKEGLTVGVEPFRGNVEETPPQLNKAA